jgi:SnoaL-like polyketide cyclase
MRHFADGLTRELAFLEFEHAGVPTVSALPVGLWQARRLGCRPGSPADISRNGARGRLRSASLKGTPGNTRRERRPLMSIEENKAVVGRWFTEFWGKDYNPAVIDRLAAPDIRFEYSLHAPLRGRESVRAFAERFRAAFPDLNFWGTADLIAEGDYVVGQWEGGSPTPETRSTTCLTARCLPTPARPCDLPAPPS